MKEFVEKLIERLEREKNSAINVYTKYEINLDLGRVFGFEKSLEIVNQLAGEYKKEPYAIYETIRSNRLDCEVPSDYFEQIKEVRVIDEWTEESKVFNQDSTKNNQGWILCSEKLPTFEGFYYHDVITTDESGVVEVAFYNNHEKEWYKSDSGYEGEYEVKRHIIAWRNLPDPYKPEEKQEEPQPNFYTERFNRVQ